MSSHICSDNKTCNDSEVHNISSIFAWNMLRKEKKSILIDVRTKLEWDIIGYPELSSLDKETYKISWRIAPSMKCNENFIKELQCLDSDYNTPIIFICKSGGRSLEAAVAAMSFGYKKCYNILGGFEGIEKAGDNNIQGWKEQQLPWKRS
ncbi:Rhodanese-related sulfurtransferase [Rickettsiales bacterium Ac37b]|nr:Rhodanese-related sulfurtransferase [Rickettsiales bacterium Ac37b]